MYILLYSLSHYSQNDNVRAFLIHIALKFMQIDINTGLYFCLAFSCIFIPTEVNISHFQIPFLLFETLTGQEIKL